MTERAARGDGRDRRVFGEPNPETLDRFYTGMRPYWFPVVESDKLQDGVPFAVELLGEPIVVVRLDGRPVAMQDLCRHYQAPLSLGEVVEWEGRQCLMCPYHGWTYDAGGRCVRIPQLGDRSIPASARVPSYLVEDRYGLIWVSLSDEPRFGIPDYPEFDDASFRKNAIRTYEPYKASAIRVLMGSLDDTHYPWVHEGLLGVREEPEPPAHKVWRHGDQYLTAQYTIEQPRSVLTADESALGDEAEQQGALETVTYTNTVAMPNTIRLVKDIDSSKQLVIWTTSTPHRYDLTSSFWRIARNFDLEPARDVEYEAFADKVREQDRPIWEGQRPWLLPPFWTKVELPLRPADLPLIGYQKWLEELEISIDV